MKSHLLSFAVLFGSAFAQCTTPQGDPLCDAMGPAFNAAAAVNLSSPPPKDPNQKNGREDKFHLFADASFIYWYGAEEGLNLATNGVLTPGTPGTLNYAVNTSTVFQSFGYKPGFKVGVGAVAQHEWVMRADYTWYRGTNTQTSGAPPATQTSAAGVAATTGTPVWVVSDWFLQGTPSQALAGTSVSSKWKIALDEIDLTMSRPYYQGKSLTIAPFGGLSSIFIRQSMTVDLTESAGLLTGALSPQPITSNNTSHSWSIGPKLGLNGDLLLCSGFRLEGEAAASLLYTQYTTVKHSEDAASTTFTPGPYTVSYTNYNCVRPVAELGLGIGWGTYLADRKFHIDFSADYDFTYFWSQNMMRKLLDDTLAGTSSSAADLYFHGLTATARFDF